MNKTVLLIGTLDTKGIEFDFVRQLILAQNTQVLLIDVGIFDPLTRADISASEVARAGGQELEDLRQSHDRNLAIETMIRGVEKITNELYQQAKFDAVLSLGGSGGTAIATAAMRQLPVGVPKLMVSTLASGDISHYVDIKDICFMYSVVDIAGINPLSRKILGNAVAMILGTLHFSIPSENEADKPLIAASMFGVTTPCLTQLRTILEAQGYELLVFHATGSGGRAMESLIDAGFVQAVADVTTTELCDELIGGVLSAGPDRLQAAARQGIPQVVSVGALDMVNFWAMDTIPSKFSERQFYKHNDNVTLMRTLPDENAQLGKILAEKVNQSTAPVTVILPLKGISMIDAQGEAFYDPLADQALFTAIRENLSERIERLELDCHINDPEFAQAIADCLMKYIDVSEG